MSKVVKVYKSSIVPAGEKMEGIQANQMEASSHTIEVIHVMCFLAISAFLFAALWKQAKKLG